MYAIIDEEAILLGIAVFDATDVMIGVMTPVFSQLIHPHTLYKSSSTNTCVEMTFNRTLHHKQ